MENWDENIRVVSWTEVMEIYRQLEDDGLTLLIRGFEKHGSHNFMILTAPQITMAVDIDTTLSIPHRGGINGVMR